MASDRQESQPVSGLGEPGQVLSDWKYAEGGNSRKIPTYSVIVPAFNECGSIASVLAGLRNLPGSPEILVIDDGSTDATGEIAALAGAKVIRHSQNRGYGASLKTGIRAATGEYVVLCDADGQHRAEELEKLLAFLPDNDLVIGCRPDGSSSPWLRRPGKRILHVFVQYLSERRIPDFNSGMRAFRREIILNLLHLMPDGFSFSTTSTVAFHRMGYEVENLPIKVYPRENDSSQVRIIADGIRIMSLIFRLIILFNPLRVFLPASLTFITASIVYFFYYCATIRIHISESMVLLFITGILLFFLGVVCDQVSAMRRELHLRRSGKS